MEAIVEAIHTRSLLLLLDNCERLADACCRLIDALLRDCPNLRLLATSREALNVEGEVSWPVPSLSTPAAGEPSHVDQEFDSVRLFAQRARAVLPSWHLTPEGTAAVAEICRRLDGIPLAIELAAARVRVLSPQEIAARLDDRFHLLTAGSRTGQPRHQTLRALVDWSHDLLSGRERLLFRRLSVFAGGWTLRAAEDICTGEGIERPSVLTLLAALVDKSLVVVFSGGEETRYGMLETLRQYASEKLEESGEAPYVRGRHLVWFRDLAVSMESALQGPDQARMFGRLETELGNLRSAVHRSKIDPAGIFDGLRLSGALIRFWYFGGHATEGESWLSALLALPAEPGEGGDGSRAQKSARATALTAAGFLTVLQRRSHESRAFAEQALALWRELGDGRGIASSLWELGQGARIESKLERAQTFLEESLSVGRQLCSRPLMSAALRELGGVAHERRDYRRARELYEESLTLGREEGDLRRVVLALLRLGLLALDQDFLPAARTQLRESLVVSQKAGLRVGFAPAVDLLACLAAIESHPIAALRLAGAAASMIGALGATESAYVETHTRAEPHLEAARKALGEAVGASQVWKAS